ncbi:hypothetical protein [Methanobrevibacter sp.]
MDVDDFTYAKGYRSADDAMHLIKGSFDEIVAAMESVVDKHKQFDGVIAKDDNVMVIKTVIFNAALKRVIRVSFIQSDGGYLVNATTMNLPQNQPSGLPKKLIFETLNELGRSEEAKEFSSKQNKDELKSLGKGILGGAVSIVKMVVTIIAIMIIIGLIRMIF